MKGFTLIELVIILTIIGLLIGGITKLSGHMHSRTYQLCQGDPDCIYARHNGYKSYHND